MEKILVIDDDEEILEVVKLILTIEGFEVEIENRWKETFNKIQTFQPDLILLDVSLGGEDGRNISRQIKSKPFSKHIHIVLFSAKLGVHKHFSECLADDFISKPFDAQELLNKIYAQLSKNSGLN
ncbi:MAG: response regulator [Bacteroidota bacterium]|nr:response regulator [Bacteroidota bacterium]MDQ6888733.1 response regulator [Bacteroidota bacterium]